MVLAVLTRNRLSGGPIPAAAAPPIPPRPFFSPLGLLAATGGGCGSPYLRQDEAGHRVAVHGDVQAPVGVIRWSPHRWRRRSERAGR